MKGEKIELLHGVRAAKGGGIGVGLELKKF